VSVPDGLQLGKEDNGSRKGGYYACTPQPRCDSGAPDRSPFVMNADDSKVIQSFPVTGGADADVYDSRTGLLLVSTREGWVHIFEDSPDHYSAAGKVKTQWGAKTMAPDSKTGRLFVDTADFGKAPEPTKEHPHPRPPAIPGTFRLLVYSR
jgi:hypothetical protein